MTVLMKVVLVLVIAPALVQTAAAQVQPQSNEPNSTKANGQISGVVTSTSGSLPNDTVVYATSPASSGQPRSALVKSDGSFKIENLQAGIYRLWAAAPGFVQEAQQTTPDSRLLYHLGDSATLGLRKGGVITGKVVNSSNAPVVSVTVRAFRVADEAGKRIESVTAIVEKMTDDRGIYRMYGLSPGTYVVAAGGASRFFGPAGATPYDRDVLTFAPSSTRDTAMSITLRSGDEATADIQYRSEPGHSISGSVAGIPSSDSGMLYGGSITLTDVVSRTTMMTASTSPFNDQAFVFYGLPDGEYELVANHFSQTRDARASAPKRVKVQGADVSGVSLVVTLMPMISGRVVLDSSTPAECVKGRSTAFVDSLVTVRRQKQTSKNETADSAATDLVPMTSLEQSAEAIPNEKGDFVLRNLRAGTFRLSVQLPSSAWYLRSATVGAQTRNAESRVISDGIAVKQSVSGLTVTISEGAAGLSGQLTAAEGQRLPERSMVYLVPAEKENATNLLRYFETAAGRDGRFAVNNVPPGEYLILAINAEPDRPAGFLVRQDSDLRATIVREADKSKQSVTLKACERLDNFEVPFRVKPQ